MDRLGSQPDEVLELVLSFLPCRQAVTTSRLARRWHHLWRCTPAVQLQRETSDNAFRLFVNSLLFHRAAAVSSLPLRSFEIDTTIAHPLERVDESDDPEDDDDDEIMYLCIQRCLDPHVDLWIRHGVTTCRARSLTASFAGKDGDGVLWTPCRPFAFTSSRHLTTMRLHGVKLVDKGVLDFSGCSASSNAKTKTITATPLGPLSPQRNGDDNDQNLSPRRAFVVYKDDDDE